MSDNVIQTLQRLVQDVIAPDVRELKVRLNALEKQIDTRFSSIDQQLKMMDQRNELQFKAMMSAMSESRAQSELSNMRVIASLAERVAVLEAKRQ